MPTYSIVGPDGRTYSIDGPEGATREQVIRAIQARIGRIPAPYEPTETLVLPEPTRAPREEGFFENVVKGFASGAVSTGELAPLCVAAF